MYIYIASIRTKLDSSLEGSKALKKLILATFLANFPRRSIFPRENLGLRASTHWEEVMSHISSHSGGTFLANSHWIGMRRSWKKEWKLQQKQCQQQQQECSQQWQNTRTRMIWSVEGGIMCSGHAAAARHQSPINLDPMGETALLCSKFPDIQNTGKGNQISQ